MRATADAGTTALGSVGSDPPSVVTLRLGACRHSDGTRGDPDVGGVGAVWSFCVVVAVGRVKVRKSAGTSPCRSPTLTTAAAMGHGRSPRRRPAGTVGGARSPLPPGR